MSSPGEKTWLICPLTAPGVEAMRADMQTAGDRGADAVECRLDWLEAVPDEAALSRLLAAPPRPVIVTLRPIRQGGKYQGDEARRLEVLHAAAKFHPAFIDVEMDVPPSQWPKAKIILSHHDFEGPPEDLDRIVKNLEGSPAAVSKIVFRAHGPEDALLALDILRSRRKPTLALAMGEAGLASRVLAKKFGAFGAFAALERGGESAPGQPSLEEMKNLYRWDDLGGDTAVHGLVGCPVAHSMGPCLHNAAFAKAGVDGVYLPLRVESGEENLRRFLDALLARPWLSARGLSVTLPHKENALACVRAENCDELARRIGAINTISIDSQGGMRGFNTDLAAAIDSLCAAMEIGREDLAGCRVAVLGAGGAARALVAGLTHYQAYVTVFNRSLERAKQLASAFFCGAAPLKAAEKTKAQVLINCTSVGMHPKVDQSPLPRIPASVRVVFDTIYNPPQTRLLAMAKAAGRLTVSGLEMFVSQAAGQFEIWTGKPAPRETMRRVVAERLARTN